MSDLTPRQLDIMRHALAWPRQYRNHYNTDSGCFDYIDCERLVDQGLMNKQIYIGHRGSSFSVTPEGIQEIADAEA